MEYDTHEDSTNRVGSTPKYNSKAFWTKEFQASDRALRKFHERGKKTIKRFCDDRDVHNVAPVTSLNLFHSNIVTLRSMMFGQTPRVEVDRRFNDSEDDVARTGTLILERILNTDIQLEGGQGFQEALQYALDDYLLPGLGVCRVRYDFETEEYESSTTSFSEDGDEVLEVETLEEVTDEWVPIEYVHWKDFKWSAGARIWSEVRWVAFKTCMPKHKVEKRWGKKIAEALNYKTEKPADNDDPDQTSPQQVAEIWEIWCKESGKLYWYSDGYDKLIETGDDPLDLEGFFPMPQPLMANLTTGALIPTPDFYYAQDLYNEIDVIEARISILTKAVKAVGVYDKSAEGVKRMLQEGVDNDLIPVDNWAMFAEKQGIRGQIDWMPIESIVGAIQQLQGLRNDTIQLLYQSTGLSDILRGQSSGERISATEQGLKAKFASIRIQAMQDRFSQFATGLQRLKAEIISKHYAPETIIKQSNIAFTPDHVYAPQAIALIKDDENAIWRIQVRPESVAMVDYAQMKQDRMEYINSLAMFMQSSAPLAALDSGITPYLIELLKWGLAGFKGSQEIEGVLDRAVNQAVQAQAQKAQQPPEPSPEEKKQQGEMQKMQMQFQQDMQKQQTQFQQAMQEIAAKQKADMTKIFAKLQADIQKEAAQARFNMMERLTQPGGNGA